MNYLLEQIYYYLLEFINLVFFLFYTFSRSNWGRDIIVDSQFMQTFFRSPSNFANK